MIVPLGLALSTTSTYAALSHPFLPALSHEGSFEDPCGAATDPEGNLYVAAYQNNSVKVYDASGALVTEFTPSANAEAPCGIAVDSAGNVYVNGWGTDVVKYKPSAYPPSNATTYSADTEVNGTGKVVPSGATSVAVDPATQNVYIALGDHISSYQPNGNLISETIGSGVAGASYYGVDVFGKNGNVYATDSAHSKAYVLNPSGSNVLVEINGSESEAGAFSFGSSYPYLAVDQSNGHVYVADIAAHGVVDEFDAAGYFVSALSHSFEEGGPSDIAVDHSGGPNEGTVYVTSGIFGASGSVFAFGPLTGGIAPEVIIEPTSEIGISKAKFNGTINPRELPNSYRFEWKQGTGASWGGAASSTPQSLPEDSSPHAVSFNATGLAGNTTYQVRLVARNAENGLEATSSPDTFTMLTPPAPTVSIDPPSSITATSASVSGAVNPRQDFSTTWELQLSTDPACASGFVDQALHKLESEAGNPTAVSEKLTGLLPSEHYCVRIRATNGGGTTTSGAKEFETEPVVPDQVETAFVAPRLNTSVRLNGRVNPEGSKLIFHFEYSEDGGASWSSMPDKEDSSEARKQIVVAEELGGLAPNTSYSYRFVVESNAGEVSPQGEVKTFTTRTDAEVQQPSSCPNEDVRQAQHTDSYLADCRAIELVNTPDKGNQNVTAEMMAEDGERTLWSVRGGAPGGTASAGNSFLAERMASGWRSRNLVPPAAQQFGQGNLPYKVENATSDLSTFVFNAGNPSIALAHGKTLIRLDREQHQEVLASYEQEVNGSNSEISSDGSHVLVVEPDTQQLEDIGNPEAPETISLIPPPGSPLGVPQPGGTPSGCGLSTTGESFAGWSPGSAAGAHWNPGYRMMAVGDASRVYFETRPDGDCGGSYGLYERNREIDATTLIDPGTPSRNVEFIRATPDGRSAYFATFSQLDSADQNTGADVYRWDEEAEPGQRYTCLTCVVPNADIAFFNGGLLPIMVSNDFSHIYFQSRAQLVPGQGQAGSLNTYVLTGGEIRFVAGEGVGRMGVSGGNAGKPGALLSSDGNVLVFRSTGEGSEGLTADSLPAQCSSFGELEPCDELYLYDDRDGSLECLSCRHDGETTGGISPAFKFAMAADGSTVAFITTESLVPRDVNQGLDVYEWRNGTVHLISDGVRSFQRSFARPEVGGVDGNGKNIFFALVAPGLTGFEQDGLRNLYDARIGGGFLPPTPSTHCSEDSCQGPLQNAPAPPTPASANESAGNVVESHRHHPCVGKRGKAKRRCIKRHRRRSQKREIDHNTGGSR